jgi:hypothetical protein
MDDEYNNFVYATPRGEYRGGPGLSLNDYWVQCVEDKGFKPYFSKSHVRSFIACNANTALTGRHSPHSLSGHRFLTATQARDSHG